MLTSGSKLIQSYWESKVKQMSLTSIEVGTAQLPATKYAAL